MRTHKEKLKMDKAKMNHDHYNKLLDERRKRLEELNIQRQSKVLNKSQS